MRHKIIAIVFSIILSGCSSIDCTKVFDQEQAAKLLHQNRTTQPTKQMIKLSLPNKRHWQRIDMSLGTVGTPIMLIPTQETPENWTQSIRTKILPLMNDRDATAYKLVQNEIHTAKDDCQQANSDILSLNAQYVFYRIHLINCHDEKNQIQFGKAMKGTDAIYLVYYSAVPGQISETEINKLSHVVQNAALVNDPRYGA